MSIVRIYGSFVERGAYSVSEISNWLGQSINSRPAVGATGVETGWMEFVQLSIPNGRLWVGDAWMANESDGIAIPVLPGEYVLSVKGMDFEGHRRTSRARVCLSSIQEPKVCDKLGEVWVDVGDLGICDIAALEYALTPDLTYPYQDELRDRSAEMSKMHFVYPLGEFEIALLTTGFGDGVYPVYELRSGGQAIGLEVEFLERRYIYRD